MKGAGLPGGGWLGLHLPPVSAFRRGYGATVACLTPDQKVVPSNAHGGGTSQRHVQNQCKTNDLHDQSGQNPASTGIIPCDAPVCLAMMLRQKRVA